MRVFYPWVFGLERTMNSLLVLALVAGAVRFEGRVVEPPCVVGHVETTDQQAPRAVLQCEATQTAPQISYKQIETTQQTPAWVVRLDYL
jgi:hypothetical protein